MLATVEEFNTFLGEDPFTEAEIERAELLLSLASTVVTTYCTAVDFETVEAPPVTRLVTLEVAKRGYSNPLGYAQRSVGDVNVSFSSAIATAGMFLTAAEQETLHRYRVRTVT